MASRNRRKPASRRPTQARKSTGPSGRATPRKGAQPAVTSDSALRTAVAERSKGFALFLSRLPQYIIPGAIVVLMVLGLVAPLPFAIPALLIIFVFIGWLAFLSWPVLEGNQRTMRLVMLALILLALVGRIAGWF